jgi:hypothetical protein
MQAGSTWLPVATMKNPDISALADPLSSTGIA